jgi:hypothetical protein
MGTVRGAVLTPYGEALANAWNAARLAESYDSSSRYEERDVQIDLANMWARVALAEAAKED